MTTTLMDLSGDWKTLKGSISQDMTTFSAYFKIWRLKFSHAKMVAAALQLPNRETKHKFKVYSKSKLLLFCPVPTYLGVKLDRPLTFCHHLETLRKKTIYPCQAANATSGIGMGCWHKTTAFSFPILVLLYR